MVAKGHKRNLGRCPEGNCVKCGTWRQRLHRDHILPRWKGGSDDPSNIQLLCANCHQDKTSEDMKGIPRRSPGKKIRESPVWTEEALAEFHSRRAKARVEAMTPESEVMRKERARAGVKKYWEDVKSGKRKDPLGRCKDS